MENGNLSDILLNPDFMIEEYHLKRFSGDCCYGMSMIEYSIIMIEQ
jgi:hypothetical protein